MASRTIDLNIEQKFIEAAILDGRAEKRSVPMKLLGSPDTRFQARVVRLDQGHVQTLDAIYRTQGFIAPVVIFRCAASKRLILADGFHRHEMYRAAAAEMISAYVIDSHKAEVEAREFAAMCNRQTLLARTPEDLYKAASILFEVPEWWERTDTMIGEHIGVAGSTVAKYRVRFSKEQGKSIPAVLIKKDGSPWRNPARAPKTATGNPVPAIHVRKRGNCTTFETSVAGKTVYLGSNDSEAAGRKLGKILETVTQEKQGNAVRVNPRNLQALLIRHGVNVAPHDLPRKSHPGLWGFSAKDAVVTTWLLLGKEPLVNAVGRVLLLRQAVSPDSRAVIACYKEDAPPALVEAATAIGVEFLSPNELLESVA